MSIKNILLLSCLSISGAVFAAANETGNIVDPSGFSEPFQVALTSIVGEPSEFSGDYDDGRCWGNITKERMIYISHFITVPGEQRYYTLAPVISNGAGIVSGSDKKLVHAVARQFCFAGLPKESPLKVAIEKAVIDNATLAEKSESIRLSVGEHNRFCDVLLPMELQSLVADLPACDHVDAHCKERFSVIKDHLEELAAKAPASHEARVMVPCLKPSTFLE